MDVKGRIVGGNSRKYIPIQSASEPVIRNTVQLPVMSYQEYLKKKGIPGYDNMSSEVIFPNEREAPSPSVEEPSNSVENDGAKSEWKVWRKDKIAFFPEVILYFHGRNANPYKTIFKILIARISGKSRQRIIPVPIPLRFSTRIVVTPLIKRTNRSSPTNKYLVKRNSSKILSSWKFETPRYWNRSTVPQTIIVKRSNIEFQFASGRRRNVARIRCGIIFASEESLSLCLSSAREDILVVQVSDQRRLFRHRMPPSVYFLSTCTGVGHNRKSWVERWTPMFTGADRHLWKQHGAPLGQLVQWICAPLVRAALCLSYAPR